MTIKGHDRIGRNLRRRASRSSNLPEYSVYHDKGCSISPLCQNCPLPMCRYEHPGGLRAVLNIYRNQRIAELRRQAVPPDEIGRDLGISARQVLRIAHRLRVDAARQAAA